jgi:hypothetical protein
MDAESIQNDGTHLPSSKWHIPEDIKLNPYQLQRNIRYMAMIMEWSEIQSLNITHTTKFPGTMKTSQLGWRKFKSCPLSIQPFWISQEPVRWPWCNLAASQRRPYCVSVNSHSPVGLVSQQWDAVDWPCVLCDCHIHKSPTFQRTILASGKSQKLQGDKSGL